MAAKFTKCDEIAMIGMVSLVHDEEYGRRRVTVRLEGFDYPITVSDEYVRLLARADTPPAAERAPVAKRPGRRKGPLFDVPD